MSTRQITYTDLCRAYARRECYRKVWTVVAAWMLLMAFAFMLALGAALLCRASDVVARRSVPVTSTGFPSIDSGIYPDLVCPWCGGIMDGRDCQCHGGEE